MLTEQGGASQIESPVVAYRKPNGTLVRIVAGDTLAERRDLDKAQDRAAAIADPIGFVDSAQLLVIDEIQRVPELLLAIKASVDEDPRPGRYLLTGSSKLFGMVAAPDALPGRMETVELWPFSQGELGAEPDGFIDAIFARGPELRHESSVSRSDYAARIVRGGLPEAAFRDDAARRQRFLDGYVQALIDRDVRELSEIQRKGALRNLVRLLDVLLFGIRRRLAAGAPVRKIETRPPSRLKASASQIERRSVANRKTRSKKDR